MVQSKRKLMLLTIALIIFSFLLSGIAFAGGWHKIGTKEGNTGGISSPTDPNVTDIGVWDPDAGLWTSESQSVTARIPHLGLSSSANKCRTCHAVHNADNVGKQLGYDSNDAGTAEDVGTGQSFKLLRNESRTSECFFCHGEVGALSNPVKKPFAPILDGGGNPIQSKGMHTLGATDIPDSTVDDSFLSLTGGLTCGNCHSVHGGWTLNDVSDVPGANAGLLSTRILRRDPAQNGNDGNIANDDSTGTGAAGGVVNVEPQGNGNVPIIGTDSLLGEEQLLAAFCGDCHNKNVSWTTGGQGSPGDSISSPGVSEGTRPNKFAHPTGDVDGMVDVYGKLTIIEPSPPSPRLSCDNCHSSRGQSQNKFPHQSKSHKLLATLYVDTSTPLETTNYLDPWDVDKEGNPLTNSYTGNPNRPLPNLDAMVCRGCHTNIGIPNSQFTF